MLTASFCISKDRISFLYASFFLLVIFLLPINLGAIRMLNEAVFILASFGATLYLVFYSRYDAIDLRIFSFGLISSLLFYTLLLTNFPRIIVFKDIVEVTKPAIYSIFVISGFKLAKSVTEPTLYKCVILFGVLSVFFSALVLFPAFHPIADMYKGRVSSSSYNFHFFRFSGTMGYPGGYGVWLVLPILVSISLYVDKYICLQKFLITFSILLLGLVMSGSRAAIAVLLATVSLLLLARIKNRRNLQVISIFIVSLIAIGFLVFYLNDSYQSLYYLFSTIENGAGGSFNHRLGEISRLYAQIYSGELLGAGPNNAYLVNNFGPVESAYYYYGYKFGLIGLLIYFLIIAIFLQMSLLSYNSRNFGFVFIFSIFSIVSMGLGGISNSITEEYKSFYLFFTFFGMSLCYFYRQKDVGLPWKAVVKMRRSI
jgi:hypothetical protein